MGREMTSLCGFMEDWTMQHINCWDMPQTRQVLIDISYLPFSAWSLAGVPGWRRTNMNSLLHTVTSRRKVHGHSKEGKPPHPLWPCQLTRSLLQSRVNQLGVGRNWIPHWERWLRHFRNWVENVSRHLQSHSSSLVTELGSLLILWGQEGLYKEPLTHPKNSDSPNKELG